MWFVNPRARRVAYPHALAQIMSVHAAEESREWLSSWGGLNAGPTPLVSLTGLARRLGVASVHVKDESERSPLGSFKALGAPIALVRLILRSKSGLDPRRVLAGAYAAQLAGLTVVSATDGNHGRALAAAARSAGLSCVIVLHANVSLEREQAIAAHGARIVRIAGHYDESVAEARRLAEANGWIVVSDTSYEGYETIPRDVMQGYAAIAAEVLEQRPGGSAGDCPFTHVFLQGGVGGLAAGVVSYLWEVFGAARPCFIVVEPEQADCLLQSGREGRPARATGSVDSVMAGLACGDASPLAWRFLESSVDVFMTVQDDDAVAAMRTLAAPAGEDMPIVAGESGAAGLAGLVTLSASDTRRAAAALTPSSRVLVINTEGATAPALYEQLVGASAAAVQSRQREWIASRSG